MTFKSKKNFSLPKNLERRPIDFGKSTNFSAIFTNNTNTSLSVPQLYAINNQSNKKTKQSFGSYIDRKEIKLPSISPRYQKTTAMSNRNLAKPQTQPQQQMQQQQQNKGKNQMQNGKDPRFASPVSEARRVKRELWWKESESQKKVEFPGKSQFEAGPKINPWNDWTPSKSDKKIESHKLQWNAKPVLNTRENINFIPGGGNKKYPTEDLEWNVTPKIDCGFVYHYES